MNQTNAIHPAAAQATTIGGHALAIAKALEHSGVDSKRVFRAAGVPLELTNDPLLRLPAQQLSELYRVCVEVTNDPYFGLKVARFIGVSNLHALGHGLAASSTLMDFCKRLTRYFGLVSQVAKMELREEGEQALLRATLLAPVSGQAEDAFLGYLILAMRHLHTASFTPLKVELRHAMPFEGSGPYEALFRAPVLFGSKSPVLCFAAADLAQPLAGSCPELAQVHDKIVTEYLARLDRSDTVAVVRQKIIEFLPTGDCTRERVAQAMCVSPTTLQARLTARETSFQDLLDDTRRELACGYIQQRVRSVTEVAFLLGFTDSSNFARAFKRWMGVSPSEFRRDPRAPKSSA